MSDQQDFISAIVLAAGRSTRMRDSNKLLLLIDKKPVVLHTIESLQKAGVEETIVVLGHEEKRLRQILPKPIKIAVNADYRQGMATSIRCGLQKLSPSAQAVFIVLADMPFLSPQTIREMRHIFQKAGRLTIVVPFYQGRQGHPVLFSRHFFADLLELQGDRGAKSILHKYGRRIVRFDCDDPAILQDIDTPAAFSKVSR